MRRALCDDGLPNSADMGPRKRRTTQYSEEARKRLGDAVATARRAAGHRWRTGFLAEANIGRRSLDAVERGEPGIGATVLEEIGRALGRHHAGWSEDTPWVILEGGPAPEVQSVPRTLRPDPRVSPVLTAHPDDPAFWIALRDEVRPEQFDELWKLYLEKREARRLLAERDFKEGHPSNG
jgi:hypothetical protein